ncbi:MAG: hypothetical protein A3I29_03790 [Candidatus Magasanikbacteria bacterium RIFCSPLOWO2_02_FULL_44_11]|uniref:Uncharacterized protein n=1 Tax=Candidatus Magasanikbacteria bacterium RIFCSPLOWO2_02_FULL_44_11 TaxID=1798689 RepID=A0A1F6NAB8_9BACT|nr:MAG: hypothetical protein A3I29_03790 [Candidatus Magasanikbacteria bacterium RIFCSPLOWO2_02_FULL_44_11]
MGILKYNRKKIENQSTLIHSAKTKIRKGGWKKCLDFNTKRQFLLDYVEKVSYREGQVTLRGSVPVKLKAYTDPINRAKQVGLNSQ